MMGLLLTLSGIAWIQDDVKPTATELRRAHQMLAGPWTIVSATDDGDDVGADMLRRKLVKDGRVVIKNRTITHVNPETGETIVERVLDQSRQAPARDQPDLDRRPDPARRLQVRGRRAGDLLRRRPQARAAERFRVQARLVADRAPPRKPPADKTATRRDRRRASTSPRRRPRTRPIDRRFGVAPAGGRRATEAELNARPRLARRSLADPVDRGRRRDPGGRVDPCRRSPRTASFRIGSRGMSVISPGDEHKRLWAYRIDPATSPKEIDLITQFDTILKGDLHVRGDRLIVCAAKSEDDPRPSVFEAPAGSRRVLYTLQTIKPSRPAPKPVRAAAGPARCRARAVARGEGPSSRAEDSRHDRRLVDDDRLQGDPGHRLPPDGTFPRPGRWRKKRLFEPATKSFNGAWTFGQSRLTAQRTGTTDRNMLGYSYIGRVQSIGERHMVAADSPPGSGRSRSFAEPSLSTCRPFAQGSVVEVPHAVGALAEARRRPAATRSGPARAGLERRPCTFHSP